MKIQPMLANKYKSQDVRGWWASEKLDGVRAVWTGEQFLTRNGNVLIAPQWFTAALPTAVLDGELWLGRGNFQTLAGLVRRKQDPWDGVTYQVFDTIGAAPTEERQDALRALTLPAHCVVVDQYQCENVQHLNALYDRVLSLGGEGLILRAPGSAYVQGRSSQLLKYKPSEQEEAIIIGYTEGEGQYAGQVGALEVQAGGMVYKVGAGLPNALRETPPGIGQLVTVGFMGRTDGGTPRHPRFIAVRDYE